MPEPKDIALEALEKMRAERGNDALFPSDEIWNYATAEVPSRRRPGAIGWLHRNGHIARTGRMRHAATAARAGSMTPEYRFHLPGTPTATSQPIETLCGSFEDACEDILRLAPGATLRLASALLSKRFLILTGLAGSGKTKLAQAFSRWIARRQVPADPFLPDATIVGAQTEYKVVTANDGVVVFRSEDGTLVPLPRVIIEEWADYIEAHRLPESIGVLELRQLVEPTSKYTGYLHRVQSIYKPAAFALVAARKASQEAYCVQVVPIGADWSGNENVLGYPNGLKESEYITKPALDLILHAAAYPDDPHFLVLDEMNLSHVERYFADILSVIESEETILLHRDADRKANGKSIPAEVELPKNLFIIGTVNVDETTYMFSPKVLDRANVIEFRMDASELEGFLDNPEKPDLSKLDGKGHEAGFSKPFVEASKARADLSGEEFEGVKAAFDSEILAFFRVLQVHGAEFGYRTAYETTRFVHFYKRLGNYEDGDATWFPAAFDSVVLQKLLPKLHGSRAKLGPVLKKLWFLCVNDAAGRGADALKAAEESKAEPKKKDIPANAPYPMSAEKICRMWQLLMDNGFASFAEA